MQLPFFIARRYLFARKSHNVINIISAISGIAMAVGTAALIIILSIYNGFDALVKAMLTSVEPDLAVVPATGKFFTPQGDAYDWLYARKEVKNICTVLQDNVLVEYDGRQSTALVKGVDPIYEAESPITEYVTGGTFSLRLGERRYAAVGGRFADSMGIRHSFIEGLKLYYPDRFARFSAINPMSAVNTAVVWPSCEFSVSGDVDSKLIIVARDVMEELLGAEGEVSSVEVRFIDGTPAIKQLKIKKELASRLGPEFKVLDRSEQNPEVYGMLRYEKLAVYLIMIFIVLILGFSIFGSLRMLIIEKDEDIATLRAMGATPSTVRRVFTLEGWLITLTGMLTGLVLGVALCLLQQHFGLIRMPGNYIVDAYPVVLDWRDILVSSLSISVLGYLVALIPSRKIEFATF